MAQMKVIITDVASSKKTPVELPDNIQLKRLLPALLTKMNMPTSQGGQPLLYALDNRRTGTRIRDEDTLQSAGVQTDDILTLLPTPTAGGGSMNPRLRRLQSDYERLQKLVSQSDLIRLAAVEGSPPEKYLIDFTCRGIERLNGNQPVFRDHHQMGILLTSSYPTTKPGLRFLTPIFHPNISRQGEVCIGPWYASKWLDDLVFMVAEMIQCKIPPTRDTVEDVLNADAVNWIRSHRNQLPVDSRNIRSIGEAALEDLLGQIKIGSSDIAAADEDVLNSIRIV
jgi:ubiquitin-protein ligase